MAGLAAALTQDAVAWAQGYGGVGFPRGGGPARGLLDALYCQLASPCVLTGDNSGGTGTLRIRPSDEDAQLVLCEASNNAATEVCSAISHQNSNATVSTTYVGNNTYNDSSGTFSRYNTGFGAATLRAQSSSTNASNFTALNVYSTNGTHSGDVSLIVSGAGTATFYSGASTTVTNDFRGPILNGGSATCGNLPAGYVCVQDSLSLWGSGTAMNMYLGASAATDYAQFVYANGSGAAQGGIGYANASYADADVAGKFYINGVAQPTYFGRTDDASATTLTTVFRDNLDGTAVDQVRVYGGGTIAFPQTQTVTCADNGAGTNAAQNLDPQAHTITILNNDATGCDVTMQETSAILGAVAVICVDPASTATNVNLADVANVFNGAAPALSQGDCITIRYFDAANDLWLQTGASNN